MDEACPTPSDRAVGADDNERWHLDKKVPLALVIMIAAQTIAAVWWAASLDTRVRTAELWITRNDKLESRLTRIETILERIDRRTETKP